MKAFPPACDLPAFGQRLIAYHDDKTFATITPVSSDRAELRACRNEELAIHLHDLGIAEAWLHLIASDPQGRWDEAKCVLEAREGAPS